MNVIVKTDHPRYPWKFQKERIYHVRGLDASVKAEIRGKDGKLYATLRHNHLHIFEDYAFNGCNCAPDFRNAIEGCGAHDAMIQILEKNPGLFDEQVAHDLMLEIQQSRGFSLARVYHWALSGWPRKLYLRVNRNTLFNSLILLNWIIAALVILSFFTFTGCATSNPNEVVAKQYFYRTEEGFVCVAEVGGKTAVYEFKINHIYTNENNNPTPVQPPESPIH